VHVVAVAGHPLRLVDACEAAGLGCDRHESLAVLRAAHLVRTRGESLEDLVEAYHDRVREAVVRRLAAEMVVDCHRRLARTLKRSGRADAAELAAHFAAAGDNGQASLHYLAAAEQAAEALAFDYAARLYQLAFDLATPVGTEACNLRTRLGDALANAGRSAEAAEQYLIAAQGLEASHCLELQRRAAMHFLMSGHIQRGHAVLRNVLATVRMNLPRGAKSAIVSLVLRRSVLRLRVSAHGRQG